MPTYALHRGFASHRIFTGRFPQVHKFSLLFAESCGDESYDKEGDTDDFPR